MVDSQPPIKTIADVDAFIEKGPVPTHATVSLNPLELRFLERSRIQGKLLYLKCLFREHPAVEQHFTAIRECQLHAAPSAGRVHLRSYEHAFGELDRTCGGCFGGGKIRTFLDLGCSPGGFSSWILKHNRSATGVGITLPDADAKWAMPDDMISMPDRYRVQFDDLNNLTMCAITEGREPLIDQTNQASSAPTHGGFDLVIAGAFPTLSGRISWFVRARLFFSQLLIVLSNLAQGGSCVVCINAKPFLWIVDAIGMLRRYFTDIGASKAGKLHSVRTSCYLVCRNFGASEEELQLCTSWLHDVLRRLDGMSETPADAPDTGSPHTEEDDRQDEEQDGESPEGSLPLFGGASMSEIFDMQHRFVLDLFEPIWALQYNSIRDRFAQVLEEDSLGTLMRL
ncbi:hypothetical protein OBBRIDRAFT_735136 [Obba rivulosa]|uniref:Ribosomal RNA methyltransferase FtsJ domain-containing protein n=1 Tax=Obba rivulosa TaxID=1052685 RepID=A0A8E2ATH6_9APHY|nr:hypothetical protein OBBRIDRAFT_735136 [Obba rivulosa]